jgi:two-component system, OmpR family, phosphate regulon sensor histidine kinase PhoR
VRNRIFFKLLGAFLLVIVACTLTLDFSVRRYWERSLRTEIERSMRQKAEMFAERVQTDKSQNIAAITAEAAKAAEARATVIDSKGVVLADSEASPAQMENHATSSRPEVLAALRGEIGMSSRWSHTIGLDFLYVAAPVPGGVVRLAYPLTAIAETNRQIRRALLISSAFAFMFAAIIAAVAASSISRRLQRIVAFAERVAEGDLSARIEPSGSDEIAQVANALDRTTQKLEESFAAVETSRRELEALLNSMQEAVLAISDNGRVLWANQKMERLLPRGVRREGPLPETVRDPELISALNEAASTKKTQVARAASVMPGRVFQVTAAPMPSGGAVAVLHDLTDVERVEKTRRDFIANVSHELRTPLTSIQGYSETLIDTLPAGDASREFLEIIRKNAWRMSRLTEDLLALARVESGEKRFNLAPVFPSELLSDAAQSFRENSASAQVRFQLHDDARKPVLCDPEAIFQVFSNFLDNAIKYGGAGGAIEIGARDLEQGVEFYVRDFGPGVSSEHLPRLFERFYRVDKARSRESGGTGLGLAIAKHIVLAHGGTIRAESELNHGATFLFTLQSARQN